MIIDVGHITFTSLDFEKDRIALLGVGYKLRFVQNNLKNPSIKTSLVRNYVPLHNLALFDCDERLSVELVNYSDTGISKSRFIHDFKKITAQVKDLDVSIKFWECLGFKVCDKHEARAMLCFRSILKRRDYFIELHQVENLDEFYLDDVGFNSLALISTSLDKDKLNLAQAGFSSTHQELLEVNNKILNICFAIGPNRELIEIISIKN